MTSLRIAVPSSGVVVLCGEILLALLLVVVVFAFRHWVKQASLRKLPGPPSRSILTGNLRQMFDAGAMPFHVQLVNTYGNVMGLTGFLGDTRLVVSDPVACTAILLKQQDVFEVAPWSLETFRQSFGTNLLASTGALHRKQRKLLNPVFSIKHMREMTPMFQSVASQLRDILISKTETGAQELDMSDWLSRLALELIAQGGLGHTFHSLNPHVEESEFSRTIKEYMPSLAKLQVWTPLLPLVSRVPPRLLRLGVTCLPIPSLHNLIKITDCIHENAKAVFDLKKSLLEQGDEAFIGEVGEGKDIITILLRANLDVTDEERLPDDEILAQMSMFLFAATDTTTSGLSRILLMLSESQDVQEKLRQELTAAQERADGKLGYDELDQLPYLDAVCRETLRVFPPGNFIQRFTRSDTLLPLGKPVLTKDGPLMSVYVPQYTAVHLDIRAVNCDPDIWGPDAAEWKPERWLSPLPSSVAAARVPGVYSNLLTFIGGGRSCIGFKFAQLEMKVALSQLIPHLRFSLSKQEVVWRFGSIVTPTVKESTSFKPQMPLLVEQIQV
ncbi:cytochrome P450 [Auriscalpium vulgare]|uniref:Cytochrome P450 n=1 Tax=Auriscalpium vulgare TaxID=40419 RepID=A0ACB8S5P4_9AGAM|nr:cytochrome P450 [Auriscalpium vulgare]